MCIAYQSRMMTPRNPASHPARKLVACIALAAAFAGACADGSGLPPPNFATNSGSETPRAYQLGIGDKLKVTVFGEKDLSGEFEINGQGNISMPLVGEIAAKGATLSQFRSRIRKKLENGYLTKPRVAIEVLNYRPIYVHGEVRSGGEFEYKNGLRIRDVIAKAGGYTYRANQGYVIMSREGANEVRLSLPSSTPVLPGDNIRVPERFF